jgi:dihydrolipoamide dehydrogenase
LRLAEFAGRRLAEIDMEKYDIAVLGGGPGGNNAAVRADQLGASVCIIEEKYMGGVCLNVGCIPTKAMLHASELFHAMSNRAGEFGLACDNPRVDGPAFMKRVHEMVATIRKGMTTKYENGSIDIYHARGELTGPNTISAELCDGTGTVEICADNIVIATGAAPNKPKTFPFRDARVMTTDEAIEADDLPESILVVGGGVIGCEFATFYSELGIKTTIVEMLDRLVQPLDPDCSRAVARSLRQRGVAQHVGVKITKMEVDEQGVVATLADGTELRAAAALIAVGRKPCTVGLGLEAAGVKVEDGLIPVDKYCRTNVPHIFAVGDVAERLQYAHLAARMGHVAAMTICGRDASDTRDVVPVGLFTHPEIATVGLTEQQAREKHDDVKVARLQYRGTGTGWAYGEKEGEVKLIAHASSRKILGGIVIGYHAAETIQEVTCAMKNDLTVDQVFQAIHIHPTFVESVGFAAEEWLYG